MDGWDHTPKTVTTTRAPAVLTQNQWNWRLHNSGEIVGGDPWFGWRITLLHPQGQHQPHTRIPQHPSNQDHEDEMEMLKERFKCIYLVGDIAQLKLVIISNSHLINSIDVSFKIYQLLLFLSFWSMVISNIIDGPKILWVGSQKWVKPLNVTIS